MSKRLFIIHGWGGSSKEPMVAWLGEQGTKLGFETFVLDMPNSAVPTIGAWVKHLEEAVQWPDENTYFAGHSLGGNTILRYLESPEFSDVGGALLIAPAMIINNEYDPAEDKDIARPWVDNPINYMQVKKNVKRIVAIFSDNDESVPLEQNRPIIEGKLGAEIIIEHAKGHFTKDDGVIELPSALDVLTKFAQQ